MFAEASNLEMELDEFHIGSNSQLVVLALSESMIKEQFDLFVAGNQKPDGDFQFNPSSMERIRKDETLLLMGNLNNINRMKTEFQG